MLAKHLFIKRDGAHDAAPGKAVPLSSALSLQRLVNHQAALFSTETSTVLPTIEAGKRHLTSGMMTPTTSDAQYMMTLVLPAYSELEIALTETCAPFIQHDRERRSSDPHSSGML